MSKEIILKSGSVAIVDDDDYPLLSRYTWYENEKGYAITHVNGKHLTLMHRFILNPLPSLQVDHINRIKLDNQKSNLRLCRNNENHWNMAANRKNNTSGYRGVYFHKQKQKWQAKFNKNKKEIHAGFYNTAIEAARAYNAKAKEIYGDFAYLNPIDE